jgi:hypothetical protein
VTEDNTGIFTPRHAATNKRLHMKLSPEDWRKIGRGEWSAIITDTLTGKRWAAKGADCGARCFCDAIVSPIQ